MVRVAVAGALGRMGSAILKTALESEQFEVVAGFEAPGKEEIGRDLGRLVGLDEAGVRLSSSQGAEEVLKSSRAQAAIDFSSPSASVEFAWSCSQAGVDLVIGTTGFSSEQREEIERAAQNIAIVLSPNMASGVNVFFKIAEKIAQALGEGYDIEILEAHHRHKKDAPSGTALRVGEIIASALGRGLEDVGVYGRRGHTGERGKEEIGLHALRGGDIVGDHMVLYAGEGERIELVHRANSRQAFVMGALNSARFAVRAKKGKVYSTFDVLGLE